MGKVKVARNKVWVPEVKVVPEVTPEVKAEVVKVLKEKVALDEVKAFVEAEDAKAVKEPKPEEKVEVKEEKPKRGKKAKTDSVEAVEPKEE